MKSKHTIGCDRRWGARRACTCAESRRQPKAPPNIRITPKEFDRAVGQGIRALFGKMRKAPDAFEEAVLDVLLKELRRAMKLGKQLSITIDPFLVGGHGCHIFATPNTEGVSYEVTPEGARRR